MLKTHKKINKQLYQENKKFDYQMKKGETNSDYDL